MKHALSRRDLLAAHILGGLLSATHPDAAFPDPVVIGARSVVYADALLAMLDQNAEQRDWDCAKCSDYSCRSCVSMRKKAEGR